MDDFKIILYILAAVAYFILTQWRKAFKGPDDDKDAGEPDKRPYSEKPQTIFEEILREIQPKAEKGQVIIEEAKEKAKEVIPPLAPDFKPKYKSLEVLKPKALSLEKPLEAKKAEELAAKRRREAFEAYENEAQHKHSKYAKLLRNPESAREAFVLSEIFNKKYN